MDAVRAAHQYEPPGCVPEVVRVTAVAAREHLQVSTNAPRPGASRPRRGGAVDHPKLWFCPRPAESAGRPRRRSSRGVELRVTPSSRRRYSAFQLGLPSGPIERPRARRPCSRGRRSAEREHGDARPELADHLPEAGVPVVDVRPPEAGGDAALDARRPRPRRRRHRALDEPPGHATSESPATQMRSGCSGVKRAAGAAAAAGCGVLGWPAGGRLSLGAGFVGRSPPAGSTTVVSIRSSPSGRSPP